MIVSVMIEIPKGSRNKYEYDKEKRDSSSTECFVLAKGKRPL